MAQLEDVKQFTEEHVEQDKSVGKTTLRLDNSVVSDVKQEVGVSQNNELAPLIEHVLAAWTGDEDTAQEKLEAFKSQFDE